MITEISIHAPREGSDDWNTQLGHAQEISIHAPREGSDRHPGPPVAVPLISIHAPREGSDMPFLAQQLNMDDFNPRSP